MSSTYLEELLVACAAVKDLLNEDFLVGVRELPQEIKSDGLKANLLGRYTRRRVSQSS